MKRKLLLLSLLGLVTSCGKSNVLTFEDRFMIEFQVERINYVYTTEVVVGWTIPPTENHEYGISKLTFNCYFRDPAHVNRMYYPETYTGVFDDYNARSYRAVVFYYPKAVHDSWTPIIEVTEFVGSIH